MRQSKRQTHRGHQVAVYIPRNTQKSSGLRMASPRAFIAFRLQAISPLSPTVRISRQTLFLSRMSKLCSEYPGESCTFELRYLVEPTGIATNGQASVSAYLVVRLTCWNMKPAALRRRAQKLSGQVEQLIETSLPEFQFARVLTDASIREVLNPFSIRDTCEVRRRYFDLSEGTAFASPLQGAIDVEDVITVMLRQPAATALSLCINPTTYDASWGDMGELVPARLSASSSADASHIFGDKTPSHEEAHPYLHEWRQQIRARRTVALHIASFQLRIQLSSAERIGEALAATLAREVGGPGLLTAEAAWQSPTLPLADGAVCMRPRSAKLPEQQQSEFAIAAANMTTMGFTPWGVSADQTEPPFLAHLGEAACMFALPDLGRWLPRQGIVEKLPFRPTIDSGIFLGMNHVHGVSSRVYLPYSSRNHHSWIIGQTGAGKSTLLESIALQDIHAGRSVIVIEPHGDLIRQLLGKIPESRQEDVILFDPADKACPSGLNPLETADDDEKEMMVNAFIDLLIKLYDPQHTGIIGPRFEHGARNVMLTVMSAPGNTLVEVLRAFQDHRWVMTHLLPHVTDPLVRRYWTDQISHTDNYHKSEVLDWLVSKFSHFVTDRTMRFILGQSTSSFSFAEAMSSGKIVLLNLAKGTVGSENANFLGLILLPMILRAALSRTQLPAAKRRDVSLVIDEFHNYATDSLALMLAEARKYHVGLTLANQHVGQLTGEIRDALLGNVGSILAFRLGAADALAMESILAPSPISAHHLITLPDYTAYGRLLVSGHRTPVFTLETLPAPGEYDEQREAIIREMSRMTYGRKREDVEREINRRSNMEDAGKAKEAGKEGGIDLSTFFNSHV